MRTLIIALLVCISSFANAQCTDLYPDGGRITAVDFIVKTADQGDSGTGDDYDLNLGFTDANGNFAWVSGRLANLPGDDMKPSRVDWWRNGDFNGREVCEITRVLLRCVTQREQWKMDHVTLLVQTELGHTYTLISKTVNTWIGYNPTQIEFTLEPEWKSPYTDEYHYISKIFLFPTTGGGSKSDGDHNPEFQIYEGKYGAPETIKYKEQLPGLPGREQWKDDGDMWVLSGSPWNNIKVENIGAFEFVPWDSHFNTWEVVEFAVVIETTATVGCKYYSPIAKRGFSKWVDDDQGFLTALFKEQDFWPKWKGRDTEYKDTIGFWHLLESGDGGDREGFDYTVNFEKTMSKTDETTLLTSITRGIEREKGVEIEAGKKIDGIDIKGKASRKRKRSRSKTVTNTIRSMVQTSVKEGKKETFKYQRPSNGLPYTAYIWTTFRKTALDGEGASLESHHVWFKFGPCKEMYPRCLPAYCVDSNNRDCFECSGPNNGIEFKIPGEDVQTNYKLIGEKQECSGTETWVGKQPSAQACSNKCYSELFSDYFDYARGGDWRCDSTGCDCYCNDQPHPQPCALVGHAAYNAYQITEEVFPSHCNYRTCTPELAYYSCCTPDNLCGHGQGDCNTDADCHEGMHCMSGRAEQYGFPSDYDVCIDPNEADVNFGLGSHVYPELPLHCTKDCETWLEMGYSRKQLLSYGYEECGGCEDVCTCQQFLDWGYSCFTLESVYRMDCGGCFECSAPSLMVIG